MRLKREGHRDNIIAKRTGVSAFDSFKDLLAQSINDYKKNEIIKK